MKNKLLVSTFISLAIFGTAQAHNVWLEPAQGANNYVVKFGHEQTESYPEHKLKGVELLNAKGELQPAKTEFKQGEAYFSADKASAVYLRFDNGVWSKLPSGKYVEKTKAQEPSAEFSTNPVKFGKAILHWDSQATQAHGAEYELVPQAPAEAGKPLAILVLHKGKPVEGVPVGIDEDKPYETTNAQGIAYFTPSKGYNKVWSEFKEKVDNNPDYDRRSIEYMLTFEAK